MEIAHRASLGGHVILAKILLGDKIKITWEIKDNFPWN